jgi:hypothetical protein
MELFERQRQGGVDGNVRVLAAVHPWTLAVAVAAAAAGGGAAALAFLSLRQGQAADASSCAARSRPTVAGGGSGTCFAWLWQRKAAELFGRRQQGGVNGNVRALAAAHPWTLAAAAAAAAGGGQRCLLCLACVKVGLLTHQLMLRARGPGRQGGGSGTRFSWLASGSGR